MKSGFLRLLAMLVLLPALAHAQGTLEVIQLKYRTAEQVIPVLQPLIPPPGTISGLQNQLIVRTTQANLADIKRVLETLDAMPRRLMITVRQDAALDRERTAAGVSGRLSSGNATTTVIGRGAGSGTIEVQRGDDVVRGRVDNTRSLESDRNVQTLQVLEGNSAFIRIGQSVPVPQRQVVRTVVNGQIVERVSNAVEYRDVMSGFSVLPRVSGDSVTLEVSPQSDTLANPGQNPAGGSINVQRAATTVSGRLGEWIEIGGMAQGAASEQSAILGGTREISSDNRRILLKVEEIR